MNSRETGNIFEMLPSEITLNIFLYLNIEDLAILQLTSKHTYVLANDNRLWFKMFNQIQTKEKFDSQQNYKQKCNTSEFRLFRKIINLKPEQCEKKNNTNSFEYGKDRIITYPDGRRVLLE